MKAVQIFCFVLLAAGIAFAEEIHLKNGTSVSGKILEKNGKSVKVDSNGLVMTYYADEVEDIDGQPFASAPLDSAPAATQAPVTAGKKELVLKFIEVFGTREAMNQNLSAMLKSLPADNPETAKIRNNININEIIERLVPIYDAQFSEEDLKSFIGFYSSPQGRKLVEGIPAIMRRSVDVSTQYFQEKFPETGQDNSTAGASK